MSLFYAIIVKTLLTIITYGASIPCGIFVPSIAIGASFGRMVGILMEYLYVNNQGSSFFSACSGSQYCIVPGVYAVIGAASVLTGVTRMTITTAVIMFEITGELSNILPLMLAVMISKFIGDSISPVSISEGLIRLKGFPFLSQTQDYQFFSNASNLMTHVADLNIISATDCTVQAIDSLLSQGFSGFPIVNNNRDLILLGYISSDELSYALSRARSCKNVSPNDYCSFVSENISSNAVSFHSYADKCPIMVSEKISGEVVIELFRKLGVRYIVVADQGVLRGLITKKDILRTMYQKYQ